MGWGKTPPRSGLWREGKPLLPDLWQCPVSVGSTIGTRGAVQPERVTERSHFYYSLNPLQLSCVDTGSAWEM